MTSPTITAARERLEAKLSTPRVLAKLECRPDLTVIVLAADLRLLLQAVGVGEKDKGDEPSLRQPVEGGVRPRSVDDGLEPGAHGLAPPLLPHEVVLVSIAISLKRIADLM